MIVAPGQRAAVRDDAVSLADIAPTILRAARVDPPIEMKGRDLLGRMGGTGDLYSETEYPRVAGWSPLQALTDGRWTTIRAGSATELYDLMRDPQQRDNRRGGAGRDRNRHERAHRHGSRDGPMEARRAPSLPRRRSGCARWGTSPAPPVRHLVRTSRILRA